MLSLNTPRGWRPLTLARPAILSIIVFFISSTFASATPLQLVINAYNSSGKNSGTSRAGETMQIATWTSGTTNTSVIWSISGPGSIAPGTGSLAGSEIYSSPSTAPVNSTVTLTARLAVAPSITASYTFTITYPLPVIGSVSGQLVTASTQQIVVYGSGFVSGSTVLVNGSPVPTAFNSPNQLSASVSTPSCAVGSLPVTVRNPDGNTNGSRVSVAPMYITIVGYSVDGLTPNPGSTEIYQGAYFYAKLQGSGKPNGSWPIEWSVNGPGSIDGSGVYTAPSSLVDGSSTTITASLASCPAIHRSYTLALTNPKPSVTGTHPTILTAGKTNSVTVRGTGFVPGSSVLVNGVPVASSYSWTNALEASVPVPAGAGSVDISVSNPSPGESTSSALAVQTGAPSTISLSIDENNPGFSIPQDFLGFSQEWGFEDRFEGTQATGVNYIYQNLVRNLKHHESYPFFIRVGGESTDVSTEPTSTTVTAYSELTKAVPMHFSLGVNLGSDDVQLAVNQTRAFVNAMPAGSVSAIEIGNEPDLYPGLGLRPAPYPYSSYAQDFQTWQNAISPLLPSSVGLMGPSWAGYPMLQNLSSFEQSQASNISIVTQHSYAGCVCRGDITPDLMLADNSATFGPSNVANGVKLAHSHGQKFRIGELNSISGGTTGGVVGVSDTFGAALWAIDDMFGFANVGVDGVNWHGNRNCPFCAFAFTVQSAFGNGTSGNIFMLQSVNPLYYGMLLFRWATPGGARLLPVNFSSNGHNVKAWATKDNSGTVRVVIINKDKTFAGNVRFTLASGKPAGITRFTASSYLATRGVTLGGRTLDGSFNGDLRGSADNEWMQPNGNTYTVDIQPTSAILMTVKQ